jgi:hypothetical protein
LVLGYFFYIGPSILLPHVEAATANPPESDTPNPIYLVDLIAAKVEKKYKTRFYEELELKNEQPGLFCKNVKNNT